jgi:hypothetical protein
MVATWLAAALLIALAGFTVYRLVRSWRAARARFDTIDPPASGSA